MSEFKAGDRVICIKSYDSRREAVGIEGVVVDRGYGRSSTVPVVFDRFVNGHTWDRAVGRGWNFHCTEGYLEHAGTSRILIKKKSLTKGILSRISIEDS